MLRLIKIIVEMILNAGQCNYITQTSKLIFFLKKKKKKKQEKFETHSKQEEESLNDATFILNSSKVVQVKRLLVPEHPDSCLRSQNQMLPLASINGIILTETSTFSGN